MVLVPSMTVAFSTTCVDVLTSSWWVFIISSFSLLTLITAGATTAWTAAAWPVTAVLTWVKAWWRSISSVSDVVSPVPRICCLVSFLTWGPRTRAWSLVSLFLLHRLDYFISFSFYPVHKVHRKAWNGSNRLWWPIAIEVCADFHPTYWCSITRFLFTEALYYFFLLRQLNWL